MQEPSISPCEMESLLRQLTNPDVANEMHVRTASIAHTGSTHIVNNTTFCVHHGDQAAALRQQLRDLLETTEQYDYQSAPQVELLDNGQRYGPEGKRNIGALARQGMLRTSDADLYGGQKRSLATLAKNGQLPAATSQEPDREELVAGDGNGDPAPLVGEQWKRNMAAMARDGLIGASGRLATGAEKRNVAALARSNVHPYWGAAEAEKRNVGALARDWTLPTSNNRLNCKCGWRKCIVTL